MINLSGQRYGRWTVISFNRYEPGKCPRYYWNCKCDCGSEKEVLVSNLKSGISKSCGCLKREKHLEHFTKHGMSIVGKRHPLYVKWMEMRKRCNTPTCEKYKYYGARGITVCPRWDSFQSFYDDMFPSWRKGLTLGRKETNGPYSPENCRWETWKQQQNNKRNNRIISWNGEEKTISQWSDKTGVPRTLIFSRIKAKWPMDLVFSNKRFKSHEVTG